MADVSIWKDKKAREAFIAKGKEVGYFVGKTLGQADRAAFEKYPDQWVYFVRVDNPDAALPLPTW